MKELDLGSGTVAVAVRVPLCLLGDAGLKAPARLTRTDVCQTAPLTHCEERTTGV